MSCEDKLEGYLRKKQVPFRAQHDARELSG